MQKEKKLIVGFWLCISVVVAIAINPYPSLLVLSAFFGEPKRKMQFSVECSKTDLPVFVFDRQSIDHKKNPFLGFEVSEVAPSKPDSYRLVWAIIEQLPSNRSQPLRSITYGECPPGYKQTTPPEPLLTGHFYLVNGSEIIRKTGPFQYELIGFEKYLDRVRSGVFRDVR